MNELKYQITQIVFLVLLGLGAYWAFTHLDDGISYTRDEIVTVAQNTDATPDETINVIDNETVLSAGEDTELAPPVNDIEVVVNPTDSNSGNSDLIDDLQKIVDADIIMKSGSNGTRVGSVQKFLDLYFSDKDVVADNDFGPGTTRLVKEFQTKELNGGDGRVGPNTLKEMIKWLENN